MERKKCMKEHQSTALVYSKENIYFVLMLITSIFVYSILAVSVIGIIIIFIMVAIALFTHGLFIGYIRGNGVKLSEKQFPEVYDKAKKISEEMGITTVPDIYVIESSGILNALATRFFGKNMVILYSDIFDLINHERHEELHFILAHELAHIKRNHIIKNLLFIPANFVPFLSEAYSRACEYTCDRMASSYIQNVQAGIHSLLILSIGKELSDQVNKDEYIRQLQVEKSFFVWLSEKLSTHPPLPKRIAALETFFMEIPEVRFKTPVGKIVGVFFLFIAIVGTSIFAMAKMESFLSSNFDSLFEGIYYNNELEEAYYTEDLQWTEQLLEEGADASAILPDTDETLLHIAISNLDTEYLELYLHYTDPNVVNGLNEPLLHYAGYYGYYEMLPILIDAGADINLKDEYGNTPLIAAMNEDIDIEVLQYMLENGADPTIANNDGVSALSFAEEHNLEEVVELFQSYME